LFVPGFLISAALVAMTYLGMIRTVRDHSGMLLLSVLLMILGAQLLAVGILAEMINRIYMATNGKKIYRTRSVDG
jgi:hypothetical protein